MKIYTGASPWNAVFEKQAPPEWKSAWRIEQERRRAEELPVRRPIAIVRRRIPRGPAVFVGYSSDAKRRSASKATWRAAGLCVNCGRTAPVEGRVSCEKCLDRDRQRFLKRKERAA